ncbi:hypothetical protein C8R41DRAFT_881975 [Lentinula lateritia]|uniref:Uncharacterized protein n=1 Tax=Lentinula lateritia TaxID=40482 RepID=A0ABQ8VIP4_9AGAR|nr:hypothetical protein C8R41DRAFT_881975 [Lentinula lateritia]
MVLAAELPQISISLAPPEQPIVEPFSPFSWVKAVVNDDDGFRSTHLTPPPTHVKFSTNLPSPLGPTDNKAKGLERDRFEALLKATRERNAFSGGKRDSDLRKEIALKAHKNKQVERRALFLSKVLAPPSPTATTQPVTPPESPAVFHFRFPSPGLVSPLALFESLNEDSPTGPLSYPVDPWVEQVDYRLPYQKSFVKVKGPKYTNSKQSLPSLEQISARLGPNHVRITSSESNGRTTRLPNFLAQRQASAPVGERPPLLSGIGRLQLPIKTPQPSKVEPAALSESNLNALQSRERKAKDMLSTLRRRVAPSDDGVLQGHESVPKPLLDRRWKRHSAPADIAPRPRAGFEHPVLSIKGAF